MKFNPFVHRVNAGRRDDRAERPEEPGTTRPSLTQPACPECGDERLLFTDPVDGDRLVCLECTPDAPTDELPGRDETGGAATTAEQLQEQVRKYADEHFPNWCRVAVQFHLGAPEAGRAGGELQLLLSRRPTPVRSARYSDPETTFTESAGQ